MEFDHTHGVRELLQKLAASPLVRQTLPNAAATCQQYFNFRRENGEAMNNFLVREALGYSEFVEALLLLYEDKQGIRQHDKSFDLPEEQPSGGWQDWWYDTAEPDEEGGAEAPATSPTSPTRPRHLLRLRGQQLLLMVLVMGLECHQHVMDLKHQALGQLAFLALACLLDSRLATSLNSPWPTASSWVSSGDSDSYKLLV